MKTLDQRITEIEDHQSIADLCARYFFCIDDRDMDAIGGMFTHDGSFGSADGAMMAAGPQAVVDQFLGRFPMMGASNHVGHNHLVELLDGNNASGLLSAHAELQRNGEAFLIGLRYDDRFRKLEGRWYFQSRTLHFMYYLPLREYAQALGGLHRNRAGAIAKPADFPEGRPTWKELRPAQA
ncbi:MAG TPA: nuclear transport factor 2 family protein [Ramlibacter sp.]|nr:nuclear transport factor 2 family protein [Ramlibacter sp.]